MYIPWWALIIIFLGAISVGNKIERLEDRVQDLEDKLDDRDTDFDPLDLDV